QYGENLIRIGYDTNGQANTNSNSSGAGKTDLFLLHSNSGTWAGNGDKADGEGGTWRGFNNFTGNNGDKNATAPDYAILIKDAASGAKINTPTANQADSNTNVLQSLNISTSANKQVGQGMNNVEGVFAGGALVVNTPGHTDVTKLTSVASTPDVVTHETVYDVSITATLADVDGSGEGLSHSLVLEGIPAGATVTYDGKELTVSAEGTVTLTGLVSPDGHTVTANLTISGVADGADFTLAAHAQSYDLQDTTSTATGQDDVAVVSGSEGADSLLGSDDSDLLLGGDGSDQLHGGKGDDRLEGGQGNDTLAGGAGNDDLLGGAGDDVFVWNHGDEGTAAAPAVDVVKDFGTGNDVLNLSDLLQGENKSNLGDYLGASTETVNGKVSTVLNISTTGHLGTEGADQKIVLEGQNYDTTDQAKLVQDLISQGKLHVDL
ncbi:MAG: type I secretion C-terminal target domain-containing protein, partial [Comamonas sp.]